MTICYSSGRFIAMLVVMVKSYDIIGRKSSFAAEKIEMIKRC